MAVIGFIDEAYSLWAHVRAVVEYYGEKSERK